jgi:hypothetical protein
LVIDALTLRKIDAGFGSGRTGSLSTSFLAMTGNSHYAGSMKNQAPLSRRMLSRRAGLILALSVGACLFVAPAAADDAGVVKTSQGKVQIARDGASLPAPVGTVVRQGDLLRTAEGASAGVMLKDDTRVALGPNSQVALDQFAFNADTNEGTLFVSVLKGTLSMISGLLVKANPHRVGGRTPTATIGIRGTEFIVDVP